VFGSATAFLLVLSAALYTWSPIKPSDFELVEGVLAGDTTQMGFAKSFNEIVWPCSGATAEFSENVGAVFDCYETSSSDQIDILLLGNSHAAHLIPGILSLAPSLELRYLAFEGGFKSGNLELKRAIDYWTVSESRAKYLFINSFWEIEDFSTQEIETTILKANFSPTNTYLFNDVPNFKISPMRCKYSLLFPIPASCSENLPFFADHLEVFRQQITQDLPAVNLVDSASYFRGTGTTYSMVRDGEVLFRDQNHLNISGSIALFLGLKDFSHVLDPR
jgi:hypothetical protein